LGYTGIEVAVADTSGNRKELPMVTMNITLDVISLVILVLLLRHKKK